MTQDIIRGIDRNAPLVIAPASAQVAWRLWRYGPAGVSRMNARQLARIRAAVLGALSGIAAREASQWT